VPAVRVAAGVIGAAFVGLAASIHGDRPGMCGDCGWVLVANLADAERDTLRYRFLSLPARLARHARARGAEDQPHLAPERGVPGLLAAAVRPARARLTSRSRPYVPERRPPRRSRSRCHPECIGPSAICCGHVNQIQPP
jgi:hypothetical protein